MMVTFRAVTRGRFHQHFTTAAFTLADPKSEKRQSSHERLLAILDSTFVKAVRQTLVKLIPAGAADICIKISACLGHIANQT